MYTYKVIETDAKELPERQSAVFATLFDPTRLRLVKLLRCQHGSHPLCVNALVRFLGVTQSAVSQHLRVLKSLRLVTGERRGYHIHYSISRDTLEHYWGLLSTVLTLEETS